MNFASRFSRNAAMPSTRSLEAVASDWYAPSSSSSGGEVGLEARVEQPLREAERAGRAGGEPGRERSARRRRAARAPRSGRRARGRPPRRRCALAEQDHRLRAREPDEAGEQVRAAGVDDEAPLVERPEELRLVGCDEHEVAREREVRAGADRGAVHRGDRRLVQLPELADERLDPDPQRLGGRAGVEAGRSRPATTVDAPRSMPAQNASPVAGDQERARTAGSARAGAQRRR